MRDIAVRQAENEIEAALKTLQTIHVHRSKHLPDVSKVFVKNGNKQGVKEMLLLCADYIQFISNFWSVGATLS